MSDRSTTVTSTRVRASLATQIREAGAAQGVTVTVEHDDQYGGRLGYRINGGAWLTPGETADALGINWP